MKFRGCFVLSMCLFLSPVAAWSASAKNDPKEAKGTPTSIVDLRGQWSFTYTPKHTGKVPDAAAFKTSMPVPGCWDDYLDRAKAKSLWQDARFSPGYRDTAFSINLAGPDPVLPYLLGTGWYLKRLTVPTDWRDRQVTLRVGRVVMEAWVYVNGRQVHHHLGHSTPWEVPLAPHLKFGRHNEIVIAAANTRNDRLGLVIRGYKGRSGGIFGPVRLKVAGRARIADLFVHPEDDKLRWRVELDGKTPTGAKLKWKVRDPKTGEPLGEGVQTVADDEPQWTTGALGMRPWSDRKPKLYEIELSLWSGQTCLDVHSQPFGLRRLIRYGVRLRLNGKMIYLRGVCECAYFPRTCTPPLEIDWYRDHIRRLKECGFNWLRFHTWVPTEPYLQAADELGMLIQVEPPLGYELGEWRDIMRFCRKHPSVVIYCCGNEELLDEAKIEFLGQCAAELRQSVPDALFSPQEALRGVEYYWRPSDLEPGAVKKPYAHNPGRLEKLKEFSDVFGQYSWGQLSYGSLRGNHRVIDERLIPYERPCLTHELGITGCYINLDLENRYAGTRIGPGRYVKARQELVRAGLLDRAGRYYRNSCVWQLLMRKDAVETARKCRLIIGYDMLGPNDNGYLCGGSYNCGFMNEFDEMKPGATMADVLRYNGESVLLINDQRNRNLQAGQPLTRDLLLSWFTAHALHGATVRWHLEAADGTVLGSGEQAVDLVEPGTVKKIATISLTTPKLDRPTKATLVVQLSGKDCKLENQWDYWLFPPVPAASKSDVTVVSSLDAKSFKKLIDGARVVLLGHKPFPGKATSFRIGLAGRPGGNLATVIADHPLFDRFAHEGYCDWQFYGMLNGGTAVLFDKMEMNDAFDPILDVASSYKKVHKQAMVFEWRVGDGRLLVCGLKLSESDPAAAYFRCCLLDYVAGKQFQPRTKVQPKELAKMLKLDMGTLEQQPKADKAFDKRGQLPRKAPLPATQTP